MKFNFQKQQECKQEIRNIQRKQQDYFDSKQKVEVLEHQLKKYKDKYDSEGRDKFTIRLKNCDEDITEIRVNIKLQKEFIEKYTLDIDKLNGEIKELE